MLAMLWKQRQTYAHYTGYLISATHKLRGDITPKLYNRDIRCSPVFPVYPVYLSTLSTCLPCLPVYLSTRPPFPSTLSTCLPVYPSTCLPHTQVLPHLQAFKLAIPRPATPATADHGRAGYRLPLTPRFRAAGFPLRLGFSLRGGSPRSATSTQ